MNNPEIKILSLENSDEWKDTVDRLPFKDAFVSAEFASMSQDYYHNQPVLFLYKEKQNFIAYFFIKRKINDLPFIANGILKKDYFDIVSPEYGGPMGYFKEGVDKKDILKNFYKAFDIFCRENNIVSEFCRLNPFNPVLYNIVSLRDAQKNREVVYIDLTQSKDQIWQNFKKRAKYSVKKARKNGVKIKQEKSEEFINKMYEIYTHTMHRNQAKKEYFHSNDFFKLLIERLKDKVELFVADYNGKMISSSIFLTHGDICHYFFSGTDENYFNLCPNNLLLNEAIWWAKDRGFKIFHFGGGYRPNDSLFNFKISFASTTANFYIYSKIHNQQIYKLLVDAKNKYTKLNKESDSCPDFFPSYRR